MRVLWDLPLSSDGILVELDSGTRLRVRPVAVDDRDALADGFARLSLESRYHRFFRALPELDERTLSSLTDIDHSHHRAWVAFDADVDPATGTRPGIAAARMVGDDDPTTAEAAVTVVDSHQGRGVGRFLVDLLAATAAEDGMRSLRFEVLRVNQRMRAVLERRGAHVNRVPGDPSVLEYRLALPDPAVADFPAQALYDLFRLALTAGTEAPPRTHPRPAGASLSSDPNRP